jgi:hypothetical protein
MDPYIEACGLWESFHARMVAKIADVLEESVLESYIVRPGERSFIEISQDDEDGRRLVTCIEVLSPSNKRGGTPRWEVYLRKRQALLVGEANLVEIDLLRGATKMPMLDPWPASPYTLLVARRSRASDYRVWPAFFQRPLPPIPVPLEPPDADVLLAVQPLIDAIYARSRYGRDIDYSRPLQPLLGEAEVAWLAERLRTPPASS